MTYVDYRRFKTPFFKISVFNPTNKSTEIPLPTYIMGLVEKVEVLEFLESDNHNVVNITFLEGSREPAGVSASSPNNTYPLSGQIASTITNRTGALTDLVFGGAAGLTYLTASQQTTGQSSTNTSSSGTNSTQIPTTTAAANPIFVFQENNLVKLYFGYLEDPDSVRIVYGSIRVIKADFPENSIPSLTISAFAPTSWYDQISPKDGVGFNTPMPIGITQDFQDIDIVTFVKNLASKLGIKVITSTDFPITTLEKGKFKMNPGGMSIHGYLTELSEFSNAYYKILYDPKTGEEVLYFINKNDYENGTILNTTDAALINYKSQGSIVKRVSINADFNSIINDAKTAIDNEGNPTIASTANLQEFTPDSDNGKLANTNPPANSALGENAYLNNSGGSKNSTGTCEYSPFINNKQICINMPAIAAADRAKDLIQLEMETLGFTRLFPGMININGIGVRFSGTYRILTAKHTIDSNGFNTVVTASTAFLGSGGVYPKNNPSPKSPDTTPVSMFSTDGSFSNPISAIKNLYLGGTTN